MYISPCTSPGETHTLCLACAPTGGYYFSSPAFSWGSLKPSTQLYDYQGGSGHPKSVTWVTNILTAEMGPKLGVTKATSPPVLSRVLWTVTDRKCRCTESSWNKVLLTFPVPVGGSHQDLLSGLWQTKSNQATPNERSSSQKDGDHLGYPNKRSKDGISQDGSKFA